MVKNKDACLVKPDIFQNVQHIMLIFLQKCKHDFLAAKSEKERKKLVFSIHSSENPASCKINEEKISSAFFNIFWHNILHKRKFLIYIFLFKFQLEHQQFIGCHSVCNRGQHSRFCGQ